MAKESDKKLSALDISEVSPIIVDPLSTDDFYLSDKWKGGKALPLGSRNTKFPFGSTETIGDGDGGEDDLGENDERPSTEDVSILSQEIYYDAAGMARVKVTFKIYNSSEEPIDGFAFAIAPKV